jgi:hypothetical protein
MLVPPLLLHRVDPGLLLVRFLSLNSLHQFTKADGIEAFLRIRIRIDFGQPDPDPQ